MSVKINALIITIPAEFVGSGYQTSTHFYFGDEKRISSTSVYAKGTNYYYTFGALCVTSSQLLGKSSRTMSAYKSLCTICKALRERIEYFIETIHQNMKGPVHVYM